MKLSEVLRDINLSKTKLTGDIRKDLFTYCEKENIDIKEYGNVIAYRMSFGQTLTVHSVTDGVSNRIRHIKIENMPTELPNALKRSFLFESHKSVLFDDIIAIGGFLLDGELVLISVYQDGSTYWQHEKGAYDGRNLSDIQFDDNISQDKYAEQEVKRANRKDTFAFITVLSLMLEAERTPIMIDDGNKKTRKRNKLKKKSSTNDWIERRIYINAVYKTEQKDENYFPMDMDKEGKIKREVFVNGFLRHQPYGPEHKLRKWIYIDGFESTRWNNDKPTKIILDIKRV
jgi:hypothetical protein